MSVKELCLGLLDYLKATHGQLYGYFAGPAMAVLAPSLQQMYELLIQRPRDLEMIRLKVSQGVYNDVHDFADDVLLCFNNAKLFCSKYKDFKGVYDAAVTVSKHFQKRYEIVTRPPPALRGGQNKARDRHSTGSAAGTKSSSRSSAGLSLRIARGEAEGGNGGAHPVRDSTPSRLEIFELQASIAERVVKPLKAEPGAAILLHAMSPSSELYDLYCMRIREPMDIGTVLAKLEPAPRLSNSAKEKIAKSQGGSAKAGTLPKPYTYVDEFCVDIRRVFANAIRYNFHGDKSSVNLRRNVTTTALKFEQRLLDFNKKFVSNVPMCPPLPELRMCLAALETSFKVPTIIRNAPVGTPAVVSFIDPVDIQLSGQLLDKYRAEVEYPMDYGTITSKVFGAVADGSAYMSSDDFLNDVKLVASNCEAYWGKRLDEGGADYITDAKALQSAIESRLDAVRSEGPPLMPTLQIITSPPVMAAPAPQLPASTTGNLKRNLNKATTISATAVPSSSSSSSKGGVVPAPAKFAVDAYSESSPTYLKTSLEVANFFMQPYVEVKYEGSNQVERRAIKYLNAMLLGIIEDEVQRHYLKTTDGIRIPTCNPFVNKVDLRLFPEYGVFLTNERRDEVNLQLMARKVRSGQYGTSLVAVVQDMQRLRDNAHAFNVGDENIETRIMADCVANYFSYLIKKCLEALINSHDARLKEFILTAETLSLLDVPTTKDVSTFLQLQQEDRLEEHRKQQEEQARKRLPPPQAPVFAQALPEGKLFEGDMDLNNVDGDFFDPSDMSMFDFDLDLSNSMPLTPMYEGHLGPPQKGKGKGKSGLHAYVAPPHVKTEWENSATYVLNKICRHPFVDNSRTSTAAKSLLIADFFRPVASAEYHEVVTQPIDLSLLGSELNQGLLLDPEDFYDKLTRVFQNLVKYNERDGIPEVAKQSSQEMVIKGSHLVRYAKWLCLEHLPIKSAEVEAKQEKPELLGELRESVQRAERKTREELLFPAAITANPTDLKKLLTNLKKTKNKTDAIHMGWFLEPPVQPSDYAVYVRRPMDLGTISTRLDHSGYRTIGEVLGDIRLVFQNSIKYNAVHANVDETSRIAHQAATTFLAKFEGLMPAFSLETTERVERDRIVNINFYRLEMENYKRHLEEQQQLALFQEQEKRRRLDQDAAFRADQDVEEKKQRSLAEGKDYEAIQQKLRSEMQERAEEAAFDDGMMTITTLSVEAQAEQMVLQERRQAMRLQGLGPAGIAPAQLLPFVETLAAVREAAWDAWEPIAVRGNQQLHVLPCARSSPLITAEMPEARIHISVDNVVQRDEKEGKVTLKGGWVQHKRPIFASPVPVVPSFERTDDISTETAQALQLVPRSANTIQPRLKVQPLSIFGF